MTGADWSTVFAGAETDLSSLNGHFAAIGWQNRRIRFFTDPLGLRNIFSGKLMASCGLQVASTGWQV
ncbi:MAG: hypothetical protein H6629_13665 [Calditrichae bacterium]|nr:hypothetical protein [Calditrichia bacterium]